MWKKVVKFCEAGPRPSLAEQLSKTMNKFLQPCTCHFFLLSVLKGNKLSNWMINGSFFWWIVRWGQKAVGGDGWKGTENGQNHHYPQPILGCSIVHTELAKIYKYGSNERSGFYYLSTLFNSFLRSPGPMVSVPHSQGRRFDSVSSPSFPPHSPTPLQHTELLLTFFQLLFASEYLIIASKMELYLMVFN